MAVVRCSAQTLCLFLVPASIELFREPRQQAEVPLPSTADPSEANRDFLAREYPGILGIRVREHIKPWWQDAAFLRH